MRANGLRDIVVLARPHLPLFLELMLFEERIDFEVQVTVPGILRC